MISRNQSVNMKSISLLLLAVVCTNCDHLTVGNTGNRVILAHHENVQYNAIPFLKRVKYYFYSSPTNKIIQGILALDMLHSKSSINVTAGGVGYPFVNLRMKSERGGGLSYDIGIYLLPDFQ